MSKKHKKKPASAVTGTGSAAAVASLDPESAPQAPPSILPAAGAAWAVAFVAIVGFVYVFAMRGGPLVDRLSSRVGESVAAQAATLAKAGRAEDAAERYRQALGLRFDDPRQFNWTSQRFGELLLDQGNPQEAAEVLRRAVERDPRDLKSYRLLGQALHAKGDFKGALDVQDRRYKAALDQGKKDVMAEAKYEAGLLHLTLKAPGKAVDSFRESQRVQADAATAVKAAEALVAAGHRAEAREFLDYALRHGSPAVRSRAEKLKRRG